MTRPTRRPADGTAPGAPPNPLWGGRFAGGPAAIMRRINASIDFDRRLYAEDIAGSKAHCAMLVAQCILSPEDGATITEGLERIRAEIDEASCEPVGARRRGDDPETAGPEMTARNDSRRSLTWRAIIMLKYSTLGLAEDTVRGYLKHIYYKLHVRSRTEAAMKYFGAKSE